MIVPFFLIVSYVLKIFKTKIFQKPFKEYSSVKSNAIQLLEGIELNGTAAYNEQEKIRFYPPVCIQRYIAVYQVLTKLQGIYNIKKVVDIGCSEIKLFTHIKRVEGVEEFIGVDINLGLLERCHCRVVPLHTEYLSKRTSPLKVSIFHGSAVQPDENLKDTNAVVAIELIEHMFPHELEELPYNIFGLVQPEVAIFTTPNVDFNTVFNNPDPNAFRHYDHKFEWSRSQFKDWCNNLTLRYPAYEVWINGIGKGPEGTELFGCCSQIAVFVRNIEKTVTTEFGVYYKSVSELQYPFRTKEQKLNDILEFDVYQFIAKSSTNEEYLIDDEIHIPLSHILEYISVSCSEEKLKEYLERSEKDVKCINNQLKLVLPSNFDDETSSTYSGTSDFDCFREEVKHEADLDECWGIDVNDEVINRSSCSTELAVNEPYSEETWEFKDTSFSQMNPKNSDEENTEDYFWDSPVHQVSAKPSADTPQKTEHYYWDSPIKHVSAVSLQEGTSDTTPNAPQMTGTLEFTSAASKDFIEDEDLSDIVFGDDKILAIINKKSHKTNNTSVKKDKDGMHTSSSQDETNQDSGKLELSTHDKPKIKKQQNIEIKHSDVKESCPEGKNPKQHDNDQPSSSLPRSHSLENVEIGSTKSKNFRYSLNKDHKELESDTGVLDKKRDICHKGSSVPSLAETCSKAIDSLTETRDICHKGSSVPSLAETCSKAIDSLTETCSKAIDSGYPTSTQGMDLDLTPEQVDEIITETESSLEDEESSVDERIEQVQGNPPVVFVDNVENGDVANNNRDDEGNNMDGPIIEEDLIFEEVVDVGDGEEMESEQDSEDEGLFMSAADMSDGTIIPEEVSSAEDTVYLLDLPSISSVDSILVEENEMFNISMNGFPAWLLGITIEGDEHGRGDADPDDGSIGSVVDREGQAYFYPGDAGASGEPVLSND